jgi:hypothetical protein
MQAPWCRVTTMDDTGRWYRVDSWWESSVMKVNSSLI